MFNLIHWVTAKLLKQKLKIIQMFVRGYLTSFINQSKIEKSHKIGGRWEINVGN